MRIRQILLVHPNRAFRGLIKKLVLSELSDIDIVESDSVDHALMQLTLNSFNIILITARLNGLDLPGFKSKMALMPHNSNTPCIVLTEDENGGENGCGDLSFAHIVNIRRNPGELTRMINQICNPRSWRRDARYHIHNASVLISAGGTRIEAALINISRGGVLVEFILFSPEIIMRGGIQITIWAQIGERNFDLGYLKVRLSRLNMTEWQPDNAPAAMRATFLFTELDAGTMAELDQLLALADRDDIV